jgi:hypothetical protein
MLIMINVKLTPSGFDRLHVYMDGVDVVQD